MRLGRLIFIGVILGLFVAAWMHSTQTAVSDVDTAPPRPLHKAASTIAATPSSTPVVAGLASVKILLYNVKLSVADPITDLVYGSVESGSNNNVAGFTTETLLAKYPDCKAGALGTLVRSKNRVTPSPTASPKPTPSSSAYPTRSPSNQPFNKIIDGYVYSYRSPYFTCVTDSAGRNAVAAATAAVKNQALPTLTAAAP